MQESCTYGSVRGAPSNGRSYRNREPTAMSALWITGSRRRSFGNCSRPTDGGKVPRTALRAPAAVARILPPRARPRRRLAGELEVVLAHPVIAPLLVEFGHHRELVDDMLRQVRRPKFFVPLGSWRVAIADRPTERLGEDACVVVQVGRLRPGQIVDVTDVRRRVVEDRRDGARDVDR